MSIRVAIIEDHAGYRATLAQFLGRAEGFELVATFSRAAPALREAQEGRADWDVVLMDLEMPEMGGIEATQQLKAWCPATQVVILTVFEHAETIVDAIRAGADGYVLKRARAPELLAALRSVVQGGAPLTPAVAKSVLEQVRAGASGEPPVAPSRFDLTERELDVLRALVEGQSYKEVADSLGISMGTVRTHVRSVYRKLQVHSVGEAIHRAAQHRIL